MSPKSVATFNNNYYNSNVNHYDYNNSSNKNGFVSNKQSGYNSNNNSFNGSDNLNSYQSCLVSSESQSSVQSGFSQVKSRGMVNWDVMVDNVFKEEISKACQGWGSWWE